MATIQREPSGCFTAIWRDADGRRHSRATGRTDEASAWEIAAALEAEARFWEDHEAGVWQNLAGAEFSPSYLHAVFIGRAHIPLPRFKELLKEAGIRFAAPSKWRDQPKRQPRPGERRWHWNGEERTLDELHEITAEGVTRAALRFRLDAGWSVEDAIAKPPMSRSEAGKMGAEKGNATRSRRPPPRT